MPRLQLEYALNDIDTHTTTYRSDIRPVTKPQYWEKGFHYGRAQDTR